MDEDLEARDAIEAALAEHGGKFIDRPAMLTGWAVILEWQDDEGERWLSRAFAPQIAKWHADGMFHEALYGEWDDEED